jgi:hypothetical protein
MRGLLVLGLLLLPMGCRDGLRSVGEVDAGGGDADDGSDAAMVDALAADATSIDAAIDAPIDAAIDAPIDAPDECVVTAGAPPTQAARCGGNGGGTDTTLACGTDRVAVGLRMRLSDQPTANGDRSAHAVTLVCGRVDAAGSGMATDLVEHTADGSGAPGWTPSTPSDLATCQPGWVMIGVRAHTGVNDTLFANLAIDCGKLDATGALTGQQVTFDVAGSGTLTTGAAASACPRARWSA